MAISQDIHRSLQPLRSDFTARTGQPFNHFFCPILCCDDVTDLCMGHVVPAAYAECCRARVVQRADIDNWYGSMFEAEYGAFLRIRGAGLDGILGTALERRLRFEVSGRAVPHYHYLGDQEPQQSHSRVVLENVDTGITHDLILKEKPAEVVAAQDDRWEIVAEHDCRAAAVVTLIKAAYLTLFHMCGYRWALSGAGMSIGRDVLGRFFNENRGKRLNEVRSAAADFFHDYRHMVRPLEVGCGAANLAGTLEDRRVGICWDITGRAFAVMVVVRIGEERHAVLMPGWSNTETAVTYHTFLNGNRERLRISNAVYEPDRKRWRDVEPGTIAVHWPKDDECTTLA